jgi:signal transduction histidine kinase
MVTILVVDDEPDFAEVLAERLRTRDMQVHTAYDGVQALERVRQAAPDVVLLDITMPGPDGLATLESLKQLSPATQVILLTADSTVATAVTGMKLGACDYLIKPADLDRVLQAIHEAEKRRLDRLSRKRMAETAKLAALGELGKGVAHEINNPVHIMVNEVGWIEELLDEAAMDPDTDRQIRVSLELIRQQARRCKTITSKLLTLRPVRDLRSRLSSLDAIWAKVLEERAGRMEDMGITTNQSWDQELIQTVWAESDWGQIFGNLVDNALDAMDLSGGRIEIFGLIKDDEAVLSVTDTGRGIEEHLLTRIFEPFFSTKDVGKGIGLGLAICHGIVEAMGGSIAVRSTPGQGSVFTIKVPMAVHRSIEHPAPQSTGACQGGQI